MIEALKLLHPLWYFNVRSKSQKELYFPDYKQLTEEEKLLIKVDGTYESLNAADSGFQAFKKGIIKNDSSNKISYPSTGSIKDQYHFVARYFHKGWSLYFLIHRILKLQNPIKEIIAFTSSLSIKRNLLYDCIADQLPKKIVFTTNPKVSVILPTLNRYEHLKDLLVDLSRQSMPAFEVIIVDQSEPIDKKIYETFFYLPLKIIYQNFKGQWTARNEAIRASSGEFILLVDDDSRISSDWIEQHLQCLYHFRSDISAGVSFNKNLKSDKEKSFFHWAEEFDSGNAMVRRSVFTKIGLFDKAFDGYRMGDAEFGLRSYIAGLTSISNPLASRIHVPTNKGGMRYWGTRNSFKPISFWGSRPDPGVLYFFNRYFEKKYLCSFLLARIFLSYIPSTFKKKIGGIVIGLALFMIFSPFWTLTLFLNWSRVKKIKPNIEEL
jgi:glycosyltransferase involved in cell wall biosynthesis